MNIVEIDDMLILKRYLFCVAHDNFFENYSE